MTHHRPVSPGLLGLLLCVGVGACFSPNHQPPGEGTPTTGEAGSGTTRGSESGSQEVTTASDTTAADATDPTSGPTSDPDTTGGGMVDCDPEAANEGQCGVPTPYCSEGTCESCVRLADDFCESRPGSATSCHGPSGECLECVEDTDCSDICSDGYTCQECNAHDQCPTGGCDLSTGSCLDTNLSFWVDGTGCAPPGPPGQDPGFGSENQPYCWISTALDAVPAGAAAVLYVAGDTSSQSPVETGGAADRTVVFRGDGTWAFGGDADGFVVGNGTRAFFERAQAVGNGGAGFRCSSGGSLWLTESDISGNASGVEGNSCLRLTVERSTLTANAGAALQLVNSELTLLASSITGNGSAGASAVDLQDSSFSISYASVVANSGTGAASLRCTGSSNGLVRNSILLSEAGSSVDCGGATVENSAVDTEELSRRSSVYLDELQEEWFVNIATGDLHLARGVESPFDGVAAYANEEPRRDIDGVPRLAYPGLSEYAGSDQP